MSCLETRTIPIYLGAPDIDTYIPRECFIDFRSFRDYRELERFLVGLSDKHYAAYVESIDSFVVNGGLRPYSWNTLYDQLIQLYGASICKDIEEVCDTSCQWDWGLGQTDKDRALPELKGSYVWPWEYLTKGSGEIVVPRKGAETEPKKADEAMAPPADRLRQGNGDTGNVDLQEIMARLQGLIDSGGADVKDYYLYAQCLLAAKAYEQAIPVLNRVLDLFRNHPYALNDLGVIYFLRNDFDAALSFFTRSLRTEPHNQSALRNLLVLLKNMGRQKEEMTSILKELLNDKVQDREIASILEEFGLVAAQNKDSAGPRPAIHRPTRVGACRT